MNMTWVLIANAERADIYSFSTSIAHKYVLVKTLEHPESALHGKEITTDKIGSFNGGGGGHGGFSRNDRREVEIKQFVNEIVEYIEKGRANNLFQELALVAQPNVLGEVLDKLSPSTSKLVLVKISKNYIPAIRDKELSLDEVIKLIVKKRNELNDVFHL